MSAPSSGPTRPRRLARPVVAALLAAVVIPGLAGVALEAFLEGRTALAGPNAGGTLVVHDTGLAYTVDSQSYPSPAPTTDPPTVDNQLPVGPPPDAPGWVWKVYAAFPTVAAPRLKALVMGEQFGPDVFVLTGGLPGADDFEIPQDGWPIASGGGVGLSFGSVQTGLMVECYWFAGYGYAGGIWATAPHPTQAMVFVDDSVPPQEDPIAGLSTIGFGVDGHTVYPGVAPPGACCFPDGHCEFLPEANCGGVWYGAGTDCDPNPCPPPAGESNAGGVLVVHDTGMTYTHDDDIYPSDPPATCDDVDNSAPPEQLVVWKVYAVFPEENHPRLKALAFGEDFDSTLVSVDAGGLPSPLDFEIPQNGWPTTPGGGVGISFGETQTSHVVEVYWLGGSGAQGGIWSVAPHPVQGTIFVDDGVPPHEDPIAALGSIGFGVAGDTPCGPQAPGGACCLTSGACLMLPESLCLGAGGTFLGGACVPNPCPQPPPTGACCFSDGTCELRPPSECFASGGSFLGGSCQPNPCPQPPLGACCFPDGHCETTIEEACPGDWLLDVPCDPSPCPVPAFGACCYPSGSCVYTYESNCSTGDWRPGVSCLPNPCPQPQETGACCVGEQCTITNEWECSGAWQGAWTDCAPNPCCRQTWKRPYPRSEGAGTSAGPGQGVVVFGSRDNPCPGSVLYQNDDDSFEDAWAWHYQGVVAPDYGSVAEGYAGNGAVCGMELALTRWGGMSGTHTIDAYVWASDGCDPSTVLSLTPGIPISPPGLWPTITTYDFAVEWTWHWGDVFVGYWPNWPGAPSGFGVALDLNGPGGLPRTKIAPGIGYPTGWQDPNLLLGWVSAFGIRAYITGGATPTHRTSWSRIKLLYR